MITYGQRTISYAEMDERSSRVARALAAEGVAAQDRVAFLDKNGPEYFEVLFGGGKINAVNVAVNWRLAPAEMAIHDRRRGGESPLRRPGLLPAPGASSRARCAR